MKKSELRTGMVVVDGGGRKYLVLLGTAIGDIIAAADEWDKLSEFNEDLTPENSEYPELGIVEVRKPNQGAQLCIARRQFDDMEVVWTRTPPDKQIDIRGKKYSESTIVEALRNHLPDDV